MLKIEEGHQNDKIFNHLLRSEDLQRHAIRKWLYDYGKDLQASFKRAVLHKPKTGRTYIRRDRAGRGRRHVASAPGETAANRTGTYRKSVGFKLQGGNEMVFGVDAPYGRFLEEGTRNMEARPGLKNAVDDTERNGVVKASDFIRVALEKL